MSFQNELLQALSAQLPTLCVRTGGSGGSSPVTANVELANRDIPVLLLDTQPRPTLGVAIDAADPTTRDELITKAIDANLARHQALWAQGKVQQYDQHDLSYFIDVLKDDGEVATAASVERAEDNPLSKQQSLYESLRELLRDEQAKGVASGVSNGRPFTHEQLERVINHLVEMIAQSHLRSLPAAKREQLAPGFDRASPELHQTDFDPMQHWAEKMAGIWCSYVSVSLFVIHTYSVSRFGPWRMHVYKNICCDLEAGYSMTSCTFADSCHCHTVRARN